MQWNKFTSRSEKKPDKEADDRSTSLITLSLLLGVAAGLVFGDYCARIKVIGDIYVGLLQMTVLPYIVVSLIAHIGALSGREGRLLAKNGLFVLLGLWFIGALFFVLLTLAFPHWDTGSFFSTSLIERPESMDFVSLFVPSNFFFSLTNNLVPAVVLFCILFGVALIGVEGRSGLLNQFHVMTECLGRVNGLVAKLLPLGLFAISANAAGTLTIQEFGKLQAYLLVFTAGTVLLCFWVLPMVVASLTPIGYRELLSTTRNVLITAFVTNSVFVVLPQLSAGLSSLLERYHEKDTEPSVGPDCIVPLGYPFPDVGKVLSLLFIPFAVWFYNGAVSLGTSIAILPQGLVMTFGKLVATIPALLEAQKLPSDIFQLFLMSGVYASRLGDLMGVMHLVAFTLLIWCGVRGLLKFRIKQTIILVSVGTLLTATSIIGIRLVLNYTFKDSFSKAKILAQMAVVEDKATVTILQKPSPNPAPRGQGQSKLDRIAKTGNMRIGFNPDRLPFSFKNSLGDLVGFDVNLAYHLANELNASIVFVPYRMNTLVEQLRADHFDVAVSGITMTLKRALDISFSEPYLLVNFALVVKDYRQKEFATVQSVRSVKGLRLGVLEGQYFGQRARYYFENAQITELRSERDFFEGKYKDLDALVTSAEAGSAWTLVYPSYKVVNPLSGVDKIPLGFALAGTDQDMEHFLAVWVRLKKDDGTIRRLKDYWILGKTATKKKPRWSVIRNVLGLVD